MGRPDGTGAGEPRWLVEEDTNRGEKRKEKKGVRRGRGSGEKKMGSPVSLCWGNTSTA